MGGSVTVAVRHQGRVQSHHIHTSALVGLLWTQNWTAENVLGAIKPSPRARSKPFSPDDYGLVAIDFDGQWVGGCQSACNLIDAPASELDTNGTMNARITETARHVPLVLRTFAESKQRQGPAFHHVTPIESPTENLKSALKQARSQALKELDAQGLVPVGTWEHVAREPASGWKLEEFSDDRPGWDGFIQALRERNWHPSKEDALAWEHYFNVYRTLHQSQQSMAGAGRPFLARYREQDLDASLPQASAKPRGPRL